MNNINAKEYSIALAEVDEILYFTDNWIVSQIPSNFLKFIKENKDKSYISNINPYLPIEKQNVSDEAKALISLIYRTYIADKQEKEVFERKDKKEFENIEKQKREKYNPDNILKNQNTLGLIEKNKAHIENEKIDKTTEEKGITEIKENAFLKICNKIRKMIVKMIRK